MRVAQCRWESCGKVFKRKFDLERHFRTHTGEKPFACQQDGCKRKFGQKGSLTTHSRKHSGEKPHKCENCEKPFADSSSLSRHRRRRCGAGKYPCEFCSKSFASQPILERHIEACHFISGDLEAQTEASSPYHPIGHGRLSQPGSFDFAMIFPEHNLSLTGPQAESVRVIQGVPDITSQEPTPEDRHSNQLLQHALAFDSGGNITQLLAADVVVEFSDLSIFEWPHGVPRHSVSGQLPITTRLSSGMTQADPSDDLSHGMQGDQASPLDAGSTENPTSIIPQFNGEAQPSDDDLLATSQSLLRIASSHDSDWDAEGNGDRFHSAMAIESLNPIQHYPLQNSLAYETNTALLTQRQKLNQESEDVFSVFPAVDSSTRAGNTADWSCV